MWVKKQQLRLQYGTTDWFRTEKGVDRAVCYLPVCLIYMLSTSEGMPGWMSYRLESREVGQQLQICR